MNPVLHPYFRLSGEFEPDEITQLLEMEPSSVKRIGGPGPSDALGARLGAEWSWQPQDDDSINVADQLAYLAGALSSKKHVVADLADRYWGTFHVFSQSVADWFVSSDVIQLMAELRVHIQCESARQEGMRNDAN